ncbi:DUF4886 domain-containing protein [Lacrimispora defluvii]|uniref:DUF4886 domain-containing protein n=1 Tax=Lacrimispora defluvii TaxID=2719233 RepID=A0ABX1VVP3_9FIRM|nr:DUF4886 domain-containing protein [Lacrimispora defluvii]NNJ31460.1 hypothetical protein [Lacrimispora defluvii]
MKSTIKKIVIIVLAVFAALLIGGYLLISSALKREKVQPMDFTQNLDLKKPDPVKDQPSVLFLGNSMTYTNDLPSVFSQLSQSGGFMADVYELTEGSYRLEYFADREDEVGSQVYDALENYTWDYVILQEQSGIATMAEETMYSAARTLDSLIRQAQGEPVFFMTWAFKEGISMDLLAGLKYRESREEMQTEIASHYINIAKELDAMLAPAGIAFMRCTSRFPEIELWDEDENHPSPAGTYLSACVLYNVLYDQSPEGLPYFGDLDEQTAGKLQLIAAGIK